MGDEEKPIFRCRREGGKEVKLGGCSPSKIKEVREGGKEVKERSHIFRALRAGTDSGGGRSIVIAAEMFWIEEGSGGINVYKFLVVRKDVRFGGKVIQSVIQSVSKIWREGGRSNSIIRGFSFESIIYIIEKGEIALIM